MQVGGNLNNTYHQNIYIRSATNNASQTAEPNVSTSRSIGGNVTSTLLSLSLANALWGLLDVAEKSADVHAGSMTAAGSDKASLQTQNAQALYQEYDDPEEE
jgi:hypothetical protein